MVFLLRSIRAEPRPRGPSGTGAAFRSATPAFPRGCGSSGCSVMECLRAARNNPGYFKLNTSEPFRSSLHAFSLTSVLPSRAQKSQAVCSLAWCSDGIWQMILNESKRRKLGNPDGKTSKEGRRDLRMERLRGLLQVSGADASRHGRHQGPVVEVGSARCPPAGAVCGRGRSWERTSARQTLVSAAASPARCLTPRGQGCAPLAIPEL